MPVCTCPKPMYRYAGEDKPHYGELAQKYRDQYGEPEDDFSVSCKRCEMCRLKRADDWVTRIMHESKLYQRTPGTCLFLTLTYDRDHLPDRGWLRYHDVKAFHKRLISRCGKMRFVCAGEYGGQDHRPHYHEIIFADHDLFPDRKVYSRTKGHYLYTSELLNELWRQGTMNLIGSLTVQSAGYVARYGLKGGSEVWHPDDWTDPYGQVHYAPREFLKASNKPGIGVPWYERYRADMLPRDYCIRDGRKVMVPELYLRRFAQDYPELAEAVKAKRKEMALLTEPDRTLDRLLVRAEVTLARIRASGTSRCS